MCFNAEISLATYILGMAGCYRLWKLGYKAESVFYTSVIQMQLIEYLLWTNQTCNNFNKNITKLGIVINHIEPIALWLGILYFYKHNPLSEKVTQLMYTYIVATVIYTKYVWTDECTRVSNESKPHLDWKWNNKNYGTPYYLLFLICLVMLSLQGLKPYGHIHAVFILISYTISFIIYRDKKTVGSMWCFMASFAPWIIPTLYEPPHINSDTQ